MKKKRRTFSAFHIFTRLVLETLFCHVSIVDKCSIATKAVEFHFSSTPTRDQ